MRVQRCSGMQSLAMALLGQKQLCIRFMIVASILVLSHLNTCKLQGIYHVCLFGIVSSMCSEVHGVK